MRALSEMDAIFGQWTDPEVVGDLPLFQQLIHGPHQDVAEHRGDRLEQGRNVAHVQGRHEQAFAN